MKLIDFSAEFVKYFMEWSIKYREETGKSDEEIQEKYTDVYDAWKNTPDDKYDGKTPLSYFDDEKDMRVLLSALIDYHRNGMEVPEGLFESITRESEEAYPIILSMLMDDNSYEDLDKDTVDEIRNECILLIWDMEKEHPVIRYIQLLSGLTEESQLADTLIEVLISEGKEYSDMLVQVYPSSERYGKVAIIEILSDFYDERLPDILIEEINKGQLDRLFLCSKLIQYNDDRTRSVLRKLMDDSHTDYYTYREIRNMYEEYTGEIVQSEDFSGDPLYELEKNLYEEE